MENESNDLLEVYFILIFRQFQQSSSESISPTFLPAAFEHSLALNFYFKHYFILRFDDIFVRCNIPSSLCHVPKKQSKFTYTKAIFRSLKAVHQILLKSNPRLTNERITRLKRAKSVRVAVALWTGSAWTLIRVDGGFCWGPPWVVKPACFLLPSLGGQKDERKEELIHTHTHTHTLAGNLYM